MSLTPGFEDPELPDYVCKLKNSLYGQKQSPRIWRQHLCSYLALLHFQPVSHTACVFERRDNGICVRMLLYVDDVSFISSSLTLISRIKTELQAKFVIADLGPATYLLGVELKPLGNGLFAHPLMNSKVASTRVVKKTNRERDRKRNT
jgi:Reverse transcriptase (RNA-dependent DNA polymerase)